MVEFAQNAAILWTGGKDSAMALHEAAQNKFRVQYLVTFAPPEPHFLAHPLTFIKKQAQAIGLPHVVLSISAPFEKSYEAGLNCLKSEMGIDCVVTGDISEVDAQPNWIRDRSRNVGMNVYMPLWGRDRGTLLRQFIERRFRVLFSCVTTSVLNENWVGRELDHVAIAELGAIREKNGLDLCGENGEYHTLTFDGPEFRHRVEIGPFSKRNSDSLAYIELPSSH